MEIFNFLVRKLHTKKKYERVVPIHAKHVLIKKMINFLVELNSSYEYNSDMIINYNFNKYIQLRELNNSVQRCYTNFATVNINNDLTCYILEILQNKSKFYGYDRVSRTAIIDFYLSLIIKYYKKFASARYTTDKFI